MKRRPLLRLLMTSSATAGLAAPALSGLAGWRAVPGRTGKVIVLLELRGGNDGLNTVAPIHDPLYRAARPGLALREGPELTRDLALHPALTPLLALWKRQRLAVALGVGWPEPNRSHFRAMDQWATASPEGEGPGWLASALDRRGSPGPAVGLGPGGSAALEGGHVLTLNLAPASLRRETSRELDPQLAGANPILHRMLELEQAASRELTALREALVPLPPNLRLPGSELGQQVRLALRLIGSGRCPPVLQLAQGGYDTHANQAPRHAAQLRQLAQALAAFDAGLRHFPNRPQVTLLVVSEFGRRLRENGSGGTDHGSASVALLYGDHVPHPLIGAYPRLDRLDERGDLLPSMRPPQLYRRVLEL